MNKEIGGIKMKKKILAECKISQIKTIVNGIGHDFENGLLNKKILKEYQEIINYCFKELEEELEDE